VTLRWYELQFAADLDAEGVLGFVRSLVVRVRKGLLMSALPVLIEVEGNAGRLCWRLGVTPAEQEQVLSGLRHAVPDLLLTDIDHRPLRFDRVWELRLSSQRRPLSVSAAELVASALLSALARTGRGERLVLQWLIGPWLVRHVVPPPSRSSSELSWFDLHPEGLDSEQTKVLRDKTSEPILGVVGRIAVSASPPARRAVLRQGVMGALQLVRAPGVGIERRRLPGWVTAGRMVRYQRPWVAWPLSLNARELTALLAWPIGGPVLPGVEYGGHRHLAPSVSQLVTAPTRRTRVTGRSTYPGLAGLLNLRPDDGLRNLQIIGPTGTGKSNLMASMALQDIEAGRGVVVIDPKRDLIEAIADRIPAHRLDDVVIIDPTDAAPVGVNILQAGSEEYVADLLTHVLRELYAANWGQRTADVIHHGVVTLARHGGLTLCELPPLLTNAPFRRRVTEQLRGDVLGVAPFWYWYDRLSEPERALVTAPALNKLRNFTARPSMRAVLGQATGFDLGSVFRERKVLLVSLASGDGGSEVGQLLGSLLLGALWSKVQSRSAISPQRRHPVFFYVDEFADVLRLPGDLGDALSKCRGLGCGFVLGHQHLGQLTPTVRAAVGANARSRIVFQCGYEDASTLAKLLGGGLSAADIQHLQRYETYQSLCVAERTLSPASAVTLPLGPSLGTLTEVLASSRSRYGASREATDAALVARRQTEPTSTAVGAKRRPS
jgi:hypothetical protein